ncbi:MAG: hypothetical protein ACOH5I_00140 [Oligoflexus sp.]
MFNRKIILLAGILTCLLPGKQAFARDPSCAHLAGGLIFIDTLYGVGLGSLVSGLWVVAADKKDKVEQNIATGALAGGALGLGFGLYEVGTRNCKLVIGEKHEPAARPAVSYDPFASRWLFSFQYDF